MKKMTAVLLVLFSSAAFAQIKGSFTEKAALSFCYQDPEEDHRRVLVELQNKANAHCENNLALRVTKITYKVPTGQCTIIYQADYICEE